jgi:hypothetical protein
LRHQHSHPADSGGHPLYQYPFHHPRATPQQLHIMQQQQQHHIQRFHSEESLASRGYDGHHGGMYASRIHSSADEISSINRSPSLTSDDDQSLDESAAGGGGEESEVRSSPPSRPPSHAPWMYPSDIRIDPSSLEVSPKVERVAGSEEDEGAVGGGNAEGNGGSGKRLLTVGQVRTNFIFTSVLSYQCEFILQSPSPTPQQRAQRFKQQQPLPSASELDSELDFDDDLEAAAAGERLCDRLDLPHGVTGAEESCRSAMSSDLDFDRGDSCGSFEFLSRTRERTRRASALRGAAEDSIQEETGDDELDPAEDDEERLFCPKRPTGGAAGGRGGGRGESLPGKEINVA